MKKKLFWIILFFGTTVCAQDTKLYSYCPNPEKDETFCGFVNAKKEIVIPCGKYAYIYSSVFDKVAFVAIKKEPGIYAIDRKENVLFRVHVFDNGPDLVSEGLFRIVENNKNGFADISGNIVIPPKFDFAYPFKNGISLFNAGCTFEKDGEYTTIVGGKWGVIDKKGKVIIVPMYEKVRLPDKVFKNGNWYRIKKDYSLELIK